MNFWLVSLFILSSAASASEVSNNREAYCNELIPPVVTNPIMPANLSVQLDTQCKGKPVADEICTENVSCMIFDEVINDVAKHFDANKKFSELSYKEKQQIVLAVIKADNESIAKDPKNFVPTYERLNTTLVCKKITIGTLNGPKKVCPAPEQCRMRMKDIQVTVAEYDPRDLDEINKRTYDIGTKYYPIDKSVNPTLPAKNSP